MEERYNVYFAGQVITGYELGQVRDQLAKVFNADRATLDKLFSGKTQLIKRECDQATALKFKQAIGAAGGVAIIKQADQASTASTAPSPGPAAKTTTKTMSAAERIAALAGAPDQGSYAPANAPGAGSTQAGPDGGKADAFQLEPPGADVLRTEERAQPVEARIDTSALSIDGPVERLSAAPEAAPPAPDTSHLSMGQAGETIPTLPSAAVPLTPNTDALGLAPGDSDLKAVFIP